MSLIPRNSEDCISHERLLSLLSYDKETGEFVWLKTRSRKAKAGSVAGTAAKSKKSSNEYIAIVIDGVRYQAHQLAWFYVHKDWAGSEIDHINGDTSFNAICNLRPVTRSGNAQNERAARENNKTSGLLGAYKGSRGRWFSSICIDGNKKYLGTFETSELAHKAYLEAKRKLHKTCTI